MVSRIGKAAHPQVVHKAVVAAPIVTKTLVASHGLGLDLGGHYWGFKIGFWTGF